MRKILLILLFISALFSKTVTISTGEWEPWISESLKERGVAIDIVKKAFEKEGYKIDVTFHPWKRAYTIAQKGRVDATALWFKNSDRVKEFYYSEKVFATKDVLVHKMGANIVFNNLSDLKKYKIAVVDGYSYGQEIDDMIKNGELNVRKVKSDLVGLEQTIKRENFDIFICEESVAKSLIANNFSKIEQKAFAFHSKPTVTNPLYLLVSKEVDNSLELLEAFNRGLNTMKKDKTLWKMINDSFEGKYNK